MDSRRILATFAFRELNADCLIDFGFSIFLDLSVTPAIGPVFTTNRPRTNGIRSIPGFPLSVGGCWRLHSKQRGHYE